MQAVEFESVSKSFAEKNVIEDISFSLMQGEIFGFLGQTGQEKQHLSDFFLILLSQMLEKYEFLELLLTLLQKTG